jgi:hypothetical protein
MTLPMLETLRTESARIHLELIRRASEEERLAVSRNGGTYYPVPYEFVYLRMRITNLSRELDLPLPYPIIWADNETCNTRIVQSLVLTADIVVDPADHAIQEGPTSGIPIGRLEPGAERELETPLCFVACGRFNVHVEARAISAAAQVAKVASATLKATVGEDNPR